MKNTASKVQAPHYGLPTRIVALVTALSLVFLQVPITGYTGKAMADATEAAQEQLAANTAVDVPLTFENAYITYAGQVIAPPATMITIPGGAAMEFTAAADAGYQLESVMAVINGVEVGLSPDSNGVYTLTAAEVATTSNIYVRAITAPTVEAAVVAEEPAAESAAPDAAESAEAAAAQADVSIFEYEDDAVKVVATTTAANALPQDARLSVTQVTPATEGYNYDAYMEALNEGVEADEARTDENTILYDVAFLVTDENGDTVEVQPAAGSVKVEFQFKQAQLSEGLSAEDPASIEVTHLPLTAAAKEGADTTAQATDITARDIKVETVAASDVTAKGADSIEVIADEFSLYGISYVPATTSATSAAGSSAMLQAATAVAVGTSHNLADFLTSVTINAPRNDAGQYEVTPGSEYRISLAFAETKALQFPDDSDTMTYVLPDGLGAANGQTGSLNFTVNDGGTYYTVSGNAYSIENGVLKFNFNTSDPNFSRLTAASNARFNVTFQGTFDENASEVLFRDGISKDIAVDTSNSVTASKTANFNYQNGTIDYTVTVRSQGLSKNVVVTDTVSGEALSLDAGSIKATSSMGGSVSMNGGANGNSFTYTIPQMKSGEIVTFTYSAKIDTSKIPVKDGKITSTGNNTVSAKSDGDPEGSTVSRTTTIDYTPSLYKSNGTVTKENGSTKTLSWTVTANDNPKVSMAGGTITDTIGQGSQQYMKYSGAGITVDVYDASGSKVRTDSVSWDKLTSKTDSAWVYTVPASDSGKAYKYVISYTTEVDASSFTNYTNVTNTATTDGGKQSTGSGHIAPSGGTTPGGGNNQNTPSVVMDKIAENVDLENKEITWAVSFVVPATGLSQAVLTDTYPMKNPYVEQVKDETIEVSGLVSGESYDISHGQTWIVRNGVNSQWDNSLTLTFKNGSANGLAATGSERTITVRFKTNLDDDWLDAVGGNTWYIDHTNSANLYYGSGNANASETVKVSAPSITKKTEGSFNQAANSALPAYPFNIILTGLTSDYVEIDDVFDTDVFEIYSDPWHPLQVAGDTDVNWPRSNVSPNEPAYIETPTGVKFILTSDTLPKTAEGELYPAYRLTYYLGVKDAAALERLIAKAAASEGGVYKISNNATWEGKTASVSHDYSYQGLKKELLTPEADLTKTDEDIWAEFRITLNPGGQMLNEGNPLTMTDTFNNLSIDYSSITAEPSEGVSWDVSGNVATYTLPDQTPTVITYRARVTYDAAADAGETKHIAFSNVAEMNGYKGEVSKTAHHTNSGAGTADIIAVKLLKYKAGDMTVTLPGATFALLDANKQPVYDGDGNPVKVTTGNDGLAEVRGDNAVDGWTLDPDTQYYLHEEVAPEGYMLDDVYYGFVVTSDGHTDYDNYVYHNGDILKVKNYTGTDVTVAKEWSDGNDQHGSDVVTVKLQQKIDGGEWSDIIREETNANGSWAWQDTPGKTVELSAGNEWAAAFNKLPLSVPVDLDQPDGEYADVEYRVVETLVNGEAPVEGTVQVARTGATNQFTIANKVTEATGSVTFTGQKSIDTRALKAGETYSFEVLEGETTVCTAESDANGNITFPAINYTRADVGEHTYTVKEASTDGNGVTVDTRAYTVTVVVSDDGSDTLKVEASDNAEALSFVNAYAATGDITFTGTKTIEGRSLTADDVFDFQLYEVTVEGEGDEAHEVETAVGGVFHNDEAGVIAYPTLSYVLNGDRDDTGTHIYRVREAASNIGGIADNSQFYEVKVTVADKGNGELNVTADHDNGTGLDFVNTYEAAGDITFEGKKTVEGRDMNSGDVYSFQIQETTPDAANPYTGTASNTTPDGVIHFPTISYTLADVGEHTYTVSEIANRSDIAVDTNSYTVTVNVSDSGDGTLKVEATDNAKALNFTNTYTATGLIQLTAEKMVNGENPGDREFTFTLKGYKLPEVGIEAQNVGQAITFDAIEFATSDIANSPYEYTIIEKVEDARGVTYDGSEKHILVSVSRDAAGNLIVTQAPKDGESLVFDNGYEATGDITFVGTKTIEGRDLTANDIFAFEVSESNTDKTWTAYSDATGKIAYPTISYTLADVGEHTYTVSEQWTSGTSGLTKATQPYVVTVNVSDNGDGTLRVEASDNAEALNFTNAYEATGDVTFEGAKNIDGRDMTASDVYQFAILEKGKIAPALASNDVNGTIAYPTISYVKNAERDDTGTHTYTVREVSTGGDGITVDTYAYTVTVKVSDNGDGTLRVEASDNAEALNFTNAYKATGSITLEGTKTLIGRDMNDGEFTFAVLEGDDVVAEGRSTAADNGVAGAIDFDAITYQASDIGTHTYTVKETTPNGNGITARTAPFTVNVEVTDNGDGTLTATQSEWDTPIEFVNTYTTPTDATLQVRKTVNGVTASAKDQGKFTFRVTGPNIDGFLEASNDADGNVVFDAIPYTIADAGKTYAYTIAEVATDPINGMTYDTATHTASVKVNINDDAELVPEITYDGADEALVVDNTYVSHGETTFAGTKSVDARDLLAGETYSFTIVEDDWVNAAGETVTGKTYTATSGADGAIHFPTIEYALADEGEHTYHIAEASANGKGITVDANRYTVKLRVADDGNGAMTVTTLEGTPDGLNFTNKYEATGDVTFRGVKSIDMRSLTADDAFTFEVTEDGTDNVWTVRNDETGKIAYPTISYVKNAERDDTGTHAYTVRETSTDGGGITVDDRTYTVTVDVSDNGDGTLKVETSDNAEALNFLNAYAATGEVTFAGAKSIDGRNLTAEDIFTFEVAEVDTDNVWTAQNDETGKIAYPTISYTLADVGEHTYQVRETSISGDGITVDGNVHTVTVTVSDNGDGTLDIATSDNAEALNFTNAYTAAGSLPFSAMKTFNNVPAEGYTFVLSGGNLAEPRTATSVVGSPDSADGVASFGNVSYTLADDGKDYTYTIREVIPEGAERQGETDTYKLGGYLYDGHVATITVHVADNGAGVMVPTVTATEGSTTFNNSYEASGSIAFAATKTVSGAAIEEGAFTFELVGADDGVSQTKSNDANGAVAFDAITYDAAGTYHYTVSEKAGEAAGYTYDAAVYNATVVVTDNGDGTMTATPTYTKTVGDETSAVQAISFANVYEATGAVTFAGTKSIDTRALTADDAFTFEVAEAGTDNTWTAQNDETGKIAYPTINYTIADVGTHTYQVRETSTSGDGITVDGNVHTVTVEVSDNGDGTLAVEPSEGFDALDFTNAYKANGSVTFQGEKTMAGRELTGGDVFTFTIAQVDGQGNVLATLADKAVATGETGAISYPKITYSMSDMLNEDGTYAVSKTFRYAVTEDVPADATATDGEGNAVAFADATDEQKAVGGFVKDGVTYSSDVKTFEVEVTDDAKGTLNAVAKVETDAGMTALAEAAAADEAARTPSVSSTGLSKVATNLDGDFNSTVRVKLLGEEVSEPEPQPETEKPTFDIVFVVDASQSQGDTATALMNQMFEEAENGGYKVNIGVVKYYYVAQVTRYLDGSAGWNEASSKAGTNLPAGIMLGTQLLDDDKSVPDDNKYLVVLSDGDTYIYQKGNQLNSYMKGNVLRTNGDDAMVVTQRDSDYNNGTPFAGPGSYSWKYHNGASEPADFAPPADWDAYFATVGPQVLADAGAYETAWGWQKNNIYSYVTNAIPEDEIFDHACSADTSLYYSLVNFRAASAKYHTYAAFVYGGYNRPYGESFMTYLNGGATLDLSSLGDTIASDIENSTAVQVAKGGVIKDTIGYGYDNEGNAYDMDFVNELATTDIVFNGTVLSKSVADDGSFTFGTASDGSPLFTLTYTGKAEPGTEGYTVTFSDEVLATDTVEMRYRVHLSDPQTKTGTYGTYAGTGDPEGTVGLLVSSQATFEREGATAAFANPVVSYSALGFDNSYDATGSLTLEGAKSMEGRALTADDVFTFEVTEGDETVATGENDATGTIAFTPIAFTLDDVGTHTYTVKETSEGANGVTADSRTRTVTVEVSDNGDGTLAVEAAEDSEPIEFVNAYSASGAGEVKVQKTLTGRDWTTDDAFEFTIAPVGDAPAFANSTVTVTEGSADYTESFGEVSFDAAGTYQWTVSETHKGETIDGVTYDAADKTVTIVVRDDGNGNLVAEEGSDLVQTAAFTNTFSSGTEEYDASASVEFVALKSLEGRTLYGEEFLFDLSEGENLIGQAVNNGAGEIRFGAVRYTLADVGEHTYTVREVKGELNGVGYDETAHSFTVNVTDNGDGTLGLELNGVEQTAEKGVYAVDTGVEFVNTYSPSGSVVLEATKVLDGATLEAGAYTFEVSTGVGDDRKVVTTATNDADGNVRFPALTFSTPGTYKYTISEVVPANAQTLGNLLVANGVAYDTHAVDVTIVTTDDFHGNLNCSVSYDGNAVEDGGAATFENSKVPDQKYALSAAKHMQGRDFAEGDEFTFAITAGEGAPLPENTSVTITPTSGSEAAIDFGDITFTVDDLGKTYTYTVTEQGAGQTVDGTFYDPFAHWVTLTVVDAGDGTLGVTAQYQNDAAGMTFTNTYGATGQISLGAVKVLTGRALADGEFFFELSGGDLPAPLHASAAADGTVTFPTLTFTQEDVGRDIHYSISEVTGALGGVTYDSSVHDVVVRVADNGDGTLSVTADYEDGAEPVFLNAYTVAPASVELTAHKALVGGTLEGGEFTFELTGVSENAAGTQMTAANDADGLIAFDAIDYDVAGVYSYRIAEVVPADAVDNGDGTFSGTDGIVYDGSEHAAVVTVVDDGYGKLVATVDYDEGSTGISFGNTALTRTGFTFNKYFFGGVGTFDFTLTAVDAEGAPRAGEAADYSDEASIVDDGTQAFTATVQNGAYADGVAQVVFPEIAYAADGDYYYLVEEAESNTPGMIADAAQYLVHVTVANGTVASTEYDLIYDGVNYGPTDDLSFYNNSAVTLGFSSLSTQGYTTEEQRVSVYPKAQKYLNGSVDMLVGDDFAFELVDEATGAVLAVATNDQAGNIAFFDEDTDLGLVFDEPGTYRYILREVNGGEAGMIYDDSEITLIVTVEQGDEGLVATTAYNGPGGAEPAFYNVREGIDVVVQKVSRFGGEGLVDCTYALWMVGENGDVMIQEATSDESGYIKFTDVNLIAGQKYYFKEVEAPKGHTVDPYRTAYFSLNAAGDALVLVESTASDGWHSAVENIEIDKAKGEEN